jgi:hypothetical protein
MIVGQALLDLERDAEQNRKSPPAEPAGAPPQADGSGPAGAHSDEVSDPSPGSAESAERFDNDAGSMEEKFRRMKPDHG